MVVWACSIKKSLLLAGVMLTFSGCSSLPDPTTAHFIGTPWGLNGIGYEHSAEEEILLDKTGATWLRRGFYWQHIEKQKGVYTWQRYDDYINYVQQTDRKILVVLVYSVPWILVDGEPIRAVRLEDLDLWLNYVERTVLRYKDRADAFEIWNEPNFFKFWEGSNKEFYSLHKSTVQKIREIAPETTIISGGLWRTPRRFLKGLIREGDLKEVDGIGVHPYALNAAGSARLLVKARSILDNAGLNEIPLWVTEVGYPTEGWYLTRLNNRRYPEEIIKTMCYSIAVGAETVHWYKIYDHKLPEEVENTWDSEDFFGLAYEDFRVKPAWHAYASMARLTNNSWYRPDLIIRDDGVPRGIQTHLFRRENGDSFLVIWSRNLLPRTVSIDFDGAPIMEHSLTSAEVSITPKTRISVDSRPRLFSWRAAEFSTPLRLTITRR